VFEVLDFVAATISDYSYTVIYAGERVRWYDPQPRREVPELQTDFLHHRHEPPDIKHNCRPAPGISFTTPNLAILIGDCVELGAALAAEEVT
jgi:hypothetical protein